MRPKQDTSWGSVAGWYDEYLESGEDSYQAKVIAPNLLRILALKPQTRVLDNACGQGFFSRVFAEAGAHVVGADISRELIALGKKHAPAIPFHVASAHALSFAKDASFDVVTIVLAIQNIENMGEAFAEAKRVLVPGGRLVLVMNHPVMRIPKRSSWGWDADTSTQYRRLDGYLSQSTVPIVMNPGKPGSEATVSYHRSLQDFVKALAKSGFAVTRLEEWISHKKSEKGPRQIAEDCARKEFPMFMMLEATLLR